MIGRRKARVLGIVLGAAVWVCAAGSAAPGFFADQGRLYRVEPGLASPVTLAVGASVPTVFAQDGARERVLVGLGERPVAPDSDEPSGTDLAWVDYDGAVQVILTQGLAVLHATVAPDGSAVAYSTRDLALYLLHEGQGPARIATHAQQPAWSPDGRKIAYAAMPADPSHTNPELGLRLYDVATGTTDALTKGYADLRPLWAPDGNSVLFLSAGRTGVASFYRVSAQGGPVAQLTNLGLSRAGDGFVPVPAADLFWQGESLVYSTRYDQAVSIWQLDGIATATVRARRVNGACRAVPCGTAALLLSVAPGGPTILGHLDPMQE